MNRRYLLIGLVLVCLWATGCQQQQQAPSEKQARLLAAQNVDLNERLADLEGQIESLQRQHAEQLEARAAELARCQGRNEALQEDIRQGIAVRVKDVTDAVMTENARLREEITSLRAEIDKLKDAPQPGS